MKPAKICLLLVLLCCSVPATALAQRAARPPGEYTPNGLYRLRGKALPKYNVVYSFYSRVFDRYADGEAAYAKFLRQLGMEPETAEARALTKAALLAEALAVDVLDLSPYVNDLEAFERVQDDWLRNQVHSLRAIYDAMLAELRQAGYSVDRLETYLDEVVRPGVSMSSTGGPEGRALRTMWEFEEENP